MDISIDNEPAKREERFYISLDQLTNKVEGHIKDGLTKHLDLAISEIVVSEEKSQDFDLGRELREVKGPFIEIAGPTFEGYGLVDFDMLDRSVITSNVKPGLPIYDPENGNFLVYWGRVDFQADSQKLPIADGKVGALFGSCLESNTIPQTISEAKRVLENGGILVLQKIDHDDYDAIKSDEAFALKYHNVITDDQNNFTHTVVLKRT